MYAGSSRGHVRVEAVAFGFSLTPARGGRSRSSRGGRVERGEEQQECGRRWKLRRRHTWELSETRNPDERAPTRAPAESEPQDTRRCSPRSAGGWAGAWACTRWRGRTRCGCPLEVSGRTPWRWNWAPAAPGSSSSPRGAAPGRCPWPTSWTRTRRCRRRRRTCPWRVWRKPARTHTPPSRPSRSSGSPWGPPTSWIVSTTQASAGTRTRTPQADSRSARDYANFTQISLTVVSTDVAVVEMSDSFCQPSLFYHLGVRESFSMTNNIILYCYKQDSDLQALKVTTHLPTVCSVLVCSVLFYSTNKTVTCRPPR